MIIVNLCSLNDSRVKIHFLLGAVGQSDTCHETELNLQYIENIVPLRTPLVSFPTFICHCLRIFVSLIHNSPDPLQRLKMRPLDILILTALHPTMIHEDRLGRIPGRTKNLRFFL